MKQLSTPQEVDRAVSGESAILYKHSTTCPISAAAHRQMERFLERRPDAPFYLVDVNDAAEASEHVEARTGIGHASPQLIVFRAGEPVWNASHFDITAEALEEQLGGAAA